MTIVLGDRYMNRFTSFFIALLLITNVSSIARGSRKAKGLFGGAVGGAVVGGLIGGGRGAGYGALAGGII